MKKWIFIIAILISAGYVYFIIPNIITIKASVNIDKSDRALYRSMAKLDNWNKWWPTKEKKFLFNNQEYLFSDQTFNAFFIDIHSKSDTVKSSITIVPLNKDSSVLGWEAKFVTTYNPITRLRKYFYAKTLAQDIKLLLSKMQSFYSGTFNTYGIEIKREFVKDSALIATHDSSTSYPSAEKIYSLLNNLHNYAVQQRAVITDSPMLNIYSKDNKAFFIRVAYPIDKKVASHGKIEYKWMLKGGNILTAEVKGGENKLAEALQSMEDYMNDYSLKSPAIPFYSLISNRLVEKDSTKWVTRIYYPVMYYN